MSAGMCITPTQVHAMQEWDARNNVLGLLVVGLERKAQAGQQKGAENKPNGLVQHKATAAGGRKAHIQAIHKKENGEATNRLALGCQQHARCVCVER